MIPPLRKIDPKTGKPYDRQHNEDRLRLLYGVSIEDVALRAAIIGTEDSEYISSECIVHFVRRSKENGDSLPYEELFKILRLRLIRAVRVWLFKTRGVPVKSESDYSLRIEELVIDRFLKILCSDRNGYDDRLDFYECRFNRAVATLRSTAARDIDKTEATRQTLGTGEIGPEDEIDEFLLAAKPHKNEKCGDALYRLVILEAISSLPPNEKRVVELLIEGYPIFDQDSSVLTISKILNCSAETVKLRRRRAIVSIKAALASEEVA